MLIIMINLIKCGKLILIIFVNIYYNVKGEIISKEDIPFGSDLEKVRVVESQNATLPCRVEIPPNDTPILTLWYISNKETPVYSYDERPGQKTSHWLDPEVFNSRAFYHAHWTPPSLELTKTKVEDGRLYRCRVDFGHSNSRVSWVLLEVIVPPQKLEVITRISPVKLGQQSDVVCKAFGGSPPPQVLWFQGGEVVDSSYNSTNGEVFNTLEVPAARSDLANSFICQAINNDLRRPKDIVYLRNVTCEPLSVTISTSDESLSEGRMAELKCTVIGSNPPPLVTWYQEGDEIKLLHTKTREKDNITRSTLLFNASRTDHNKHLICRAVNKLLQTDPMEDIFTLNIAYKPSVNLSLGRSLDSGNLKEGNDVFFECNVDSNPPPYKVEWYHQGKAISHNISSGILVSKSSLALQRVTLKSSGKYVCKASNVEGDTTSKPIEINIKYAPRCTATPSLRGVALREPVNVTCTVDADPKNVKFFWTFNNSARKEQSEIVPKERFVANELQSTLFYTPTTERDYGTLLCYAENSVGQQEEPCSFTVISAGPPEKVGHCSFENVTSHSGSVICTSGFNGGLPQRFLLQVWTKENEQVVNFSSASPEFLVRSLAPGHLYTIAVTSFNSRGAADPVKLKLRTLKEAEMHKSLPSRTAPSPLTLVLGVIGGALFVVLCLLFATFAIRGRRRQSHLSAEFSSDLQKSPDEGKMKDKSALSSDPDILLQSGKRQKRKVNTNSGEKTYTIAESHIRAVSPFQVSPTQGDYDDDARGSPDVNEYTKLTSPLTIGHHSAPPASHGIGRGVSLGPSGLEVGLGKGFGSGGSLNLGAAAGNLAVAGYKEFGDSPEVRSKGCTRRAILEGVELGGFGGSPCVHQPLIKGGESIL